MIALALVLVLAEFLTFVEETVTPTEQLRNWNRDRKC